MGLVDRVKMILERECKMIKGGGGGANGVAM